MAPRPAIRALAEQQKTLQVQAGTIQSQDDTIRALVAVARAQQTEINRLANGVRVIASMAGITQHVASAMGFVKRADIQNPAQPVPEPPAGPPTQTTDEAEAPEAMADVQTPGLVGGSTNDVAADATTTAYTPGMDVPGPAFKNLVDVTQPVDGTQNPRPLSETKTLTDVRVGDPMNATTAFPLQGPFSQQQRTSSLGTEGERTMASLRLARLRINAGMTNAENDLAEQAVIFKDASMSLDSIEREIGTLNKVVKAAKVKSRPRMVPRTATARAAVPSMQNGIATTAGNASTFDDTQDADLFD